MSWLGIRDFSAVRDISSGSCCAQPFRAVQIALPQRRWSRVTLMSLQAPFSSFANRPHLAIGGPAARPPTGGARRLDS
jgi:hypothetical protein